MRIIAVRKTRRHRQFHAKRFIIGLPLLLVLIGAANYLRPIPMVQPTISPLKQYPSQKVTLAWPGYGQAAFATKDQGILGTINTQTPLATASIAKVITALCILNKYPLGLGQTGPMITISDQDVALYNNYVAKDGSAVVVQAGEQLSEYQLLEGMLLPSANNLADTGAIWAYGSIDQYTTFANTYVATHGLIKTHVAIDASGFDGATTSTASDLSLLGLLAVAQPVLSDISALPSAELPIVGTVYNYNGVLGQQGIFGLKTGNNDQDTGAFLFATKLPVGSEDVTVTGTIMGASSLRQALESSLPLITSIHNNFSSVSVVQKDHVLATYTSPWGAIAHVVGAKDVQLARWNADAINSSIALQAITYSSHTSIGRLTVSSRGQSQTIPLQLDHQLREPSFFWRLTRH